MFGRENQTRQQRFMFTALQIKYYLEFGQYPTYVNVVLISVCQGIPHVVTISHPVSLTKAEMSL